MPGAGYRCPYSAHETAGNKCSRFQVSSLEGILTLRGVRGSQGINPPLTDRPPMLTGTTPGEGSWVLAFPGLRNNLRLPAVLGRRIEPEPPCAVDPIDLHQVLLLRVGAKRAHIAS